MKRIGTILALIIIGGISVLLYMMSKPPAHSDENFRTSAMPMIQFQVEKGNLASTIEVKGKSTYANEHMVYPSYTGEIEQWNVEHGSEVSTGDVLFSLQTAKLNDELTRLQLELTQQEYAEKTRRVNEMIASERLAVDMVDYVSQMEAAAQREQNRAVEEIENKRRDLLIKEIQRYQDRMNQSEYIAEVDGIFLFTDDAPPRFVDEDTPVGKIVDLSKLLFTARVGEMDVFKIAEGMEVEVTVDALPDWVIRGEVVQISKFPLATSTGASAGSGSGAEFEVTIDLDVDTLVREDRALIAGLSLTGQVQAAVRENVLTVPTLAVMRENDRSYVYVLNGDVIEQRFIQTGILTPEKTEVIEGLSEGETIVLQ